MSSFNQSQSVVKQNQSNLVSKVVVDNSNISGQFALGKPEYPL